VPGAADALEERGDPVRRGDLADQVDVADVDAELERGGRDQYFQAAALQPLLRIQARLAGEAAVVSGDMLGAKTLRELVRHAFGEAPRVHRDERGAMRADQPDEPLVDFLPHLVRHDRLERRARHLHRQVELALVALVHDLTGRRSQKLRDLVDGLLSCGKPDALQLAAADVIQALERQREVRAATRLEHGVDFVDDYRAGSLQDVARTGGGQQEVERFRGGDEDVGWRAQHRGALGLRRVAASHRRGDLRRRIAHGLCERADLAARLGEVLVDVGRERLQRRHVDHPDFVRQDAGFRTLAEQFVDRGQERGERLPGPGGCRDQGVGAAPDGAPAFELGGGGLVEAAFPPAPQNRVKILG